MSEERLTRREILKKGAYITPVILTVKANFAFASAGSGDYRDGTKTIEYLGRGDEKDKHNEKHRKEKKHHDTNDDKKNWTNKTRL